MNGTEITMLVLMAGLSLMVLFWDKISKEK